MSAYRYCPSCGVQGRLSREVDEETGELICFECDNCHGLFDDVDEDDYDWASPIDMGAQ